jgi:predicted nuclease of restriction endonuclease-like (RecB) superfamily
MNYDQPRAPTFPRSVSDTYPALLADLRQRIHGARLQAALAVNRELVLLYWSIGRDILAREQSEGWGLEAVDRLAGELRQTFPEMTGVSARNLGYMRAFAEAWADESLVQQVAAQLPWSHHILLLDAVKAPIEREWYAKAAIEHGWSRDVLAHQIDAGLFCRQGAGTRSS